MKRRMSANDFVETCRKVVQYRDAQEQRENDNEK